MPKFEIGVPGKKASNRFSYLCCYFPEMKDLTMTAGGRQCQGFRLISVPIELFIPPAYCEWSLTRSRLQHNEKLLL